jgi:F420-dependent oxidoreductase-like protein
MPRLDFGVQIEPQYGFTYDMVRKIAESCEALGFESIWVSDHFFMTDDSIGIPCLDCWTTLTALARDTKNLRMGSMVSSQSYRNPALMAKIAATIDHISNGRLYFGIGAGWKEVEYRAYGYPFPKPVVRIRQLDETIQIARKMWTEDKPTFKGRYYRIEEALCFPKPVQRPHIPIWVGGTGALTLKVTARHADACNFAWTLLPNAFKQKLEILRGHCKSLGRDYGAIRKSAAIMITMASTERELERKLEYQERRRDTPYMRYLSRQPPNLVGTPEVVAERLREYLPLGVDHFILRFHFGDEISSMTLFVDEVRRRL